MGWTTLPGVHNAEQLEQYARTAGHHILQAHACFENGYEVLWTIEVLKNGEYGIFCTLIQGSGGGITYKEIPEFQHPYYYSCPLDFLQMTLHSPWYCKKWRAGVNARHNPLLLDIDAGVEL